MSAYTYSDELYSDHFKDVNGFRPRGILMDRWDAMTPDEKQVEWDQMQVELEEQIAEDKKYAAKAVAQFEKLITDTIELVGCDRKKAIEFQIDAYGGESLDFILWDMGVDYHDSYRIEKEFRAL